MTSVFKQYTAAWLSKSPAMKLNRIDSLYKTAKLLIEQSLQTQHHSEDSARTKQISIARRMYIGNTETQALLDQIESKLQS